MGQALALPASQGLSPAVVFNPHLLRQLLQLFIGKSLKQADGTEHQGGRLLHRRTSLRLRRSRGIL